MSPRLKRSDICIPAYAPEVWGSSSFLCSCFSYQILLCSDLSLRTDIKDTRRYSLCPVSIKENLLKHQNVGPWLPEVLSQMTCGGTQESAFLKKKKDPRCSQPLGGVRHFKATYSKPTLVLGKPEWWALPSANLKNFSNKESSRFITF